MTDAQPRFLHITNGTSTTGLMAAAGLPGLRSIWADPLHEGPVPQGLTDAELLELRRQYLAHPRGLSATDAEEDPVNDLRQWRAVLARRDTYDEVVLWFEHDLFDQLNLVQLLTWIRDHVRPVPPVSLICIGSFAGRPDFKGLGELTPGELASLLPSREPVTERQYELARRAWEALREPTPEGLDDLRRQDTSPLPYVGPAVTRFLEEYPWTSDGLSRTERRLLELAANEGIRLRDAFPRMHEGERFYYVTDVALAILARELSRASPPLVRLERPTGARDLELVDLLSLTDAGRAVLAGEMDRLAGGGIDRWLGGVHLHDGAQLWRWDPAQQRVVG